MTIDTVFASRVRELTPKDVEAYACLLRDNKLTWMHDHPQEDPYERSREVLNSKLIRVFALEQVGGHLTMSIAGRHWETMPVYTVVDFKSAEKFAFRDFKHSFHVLLHTLITKMEDDGRFEFWYLLEDKATYSSRGKRDGRNIMHYLVPHLSNYAIFNEARFQAHELPKWRVYASMLSNRPAQVPTVLRRALHRKKLSDI